MTIHIPWENNGLRLLMTIESKSLITHSKMQDLSEVDLNMVKEDAKDLLATLTDLVNNAPESKLVE